jgi:hypothetical protein
MPRSFPIGDNGISEAYSPETRLQYTPNTLNGQAIFQPERLSWMDGQLIGRSREPDLIVPLADCLEREYAITLPDGSQVLRTGLEAMLIIKAAFEVHYDEREAAELAAAAAGEEGAL